ncbi:thaumatin-like protein PWIR2 [Aegilops tauschii subsp. strangulata]|uniref:Thaumatin-like protein n=1 Tax=Aegilops tauschii TaxID=37682 RepID=M8B4U8_AEGTA|nr:thaumatin-like protein PWIR2 [Aegilops tauschii subsp. strangulata]
MATPAFISPPLVFLLLLVSFTACTDATVFFIKNQCPFTFVKNATDGRIWARTRCSFDPSTGRGGCETGDCDGVLLCVVARKPSMTLAEFTIGYGGAPGRYDISVAYGFNVPMDLSCSDANVIRCRDADCPDGIHG